MAIEINFQHVSNEKGQKHFYFYHHLRYFPLRYNQIHNLWLFLFNRPIIKKKKPFRSLSLQLKYYGGAFYGIHLQLRSFGPLLLAPALKGHYRCYISPGDPPLIYNKRPLHWTAMPALIKQIKTGQINKYFYVPKIFKACLILWENAQCVCKVSHFKSQGSIFNLIFWVKRLDYKTVRSVIFTPG